MGKNEFTKTITKLFELTEAEVEYYEEQAKIAHKEKDQVREQSCKNMAKANKGRIDAIELTLFQYTNMHEKHLI